MTIVSNRYRDNRYHQWVKMDPTQGAGVALVDAHLGLLEFRNSSGGDRPPGQGPMIKTVVPYITKPRYITEVVKTKPTYTYHWVKTLVTTETRSKDGTLVIKRTLKKKRVRTKHAGTYQRNKVLVRPPESKTRVVWKRNDALDKGEEHSYTAKRWEHNSTNGVATFYAGSWHWEGTATQLIFDSMSNTIPDPWSAQDDFALLGKLRESIAGSTFNAGVALAESPKAIKMVAESTKKIFEAYKAVKKGNVTAAAKFLTGKAPVGNKNKFHRGFDNTTEKAVSQNWLALQYGWKPLVRDIYEGMVFVDHQLSKRTVQKHRVTRIGGGGHSSKPTLTHVRFPSNRAFMPVQFQSSKTLIAKIEEASIVRLSGLLDPLQVAWELLPYSFVIDWFMPIGAYMSAKELQGALKGTFITTKRYSLKTYGQPALALSAQLGSVHDGRGISLRYTEITRTVSTTLPVPAPEIKPLSKIASWTHAANAVALLVGARKGLGTTTTTVPKYKLTYDKNRPVYKEI